MSKKKTKQAKQDEKMLSMWPHTYVHVIYLIMVLGSPYEIPQIIDPLKAILPPINFSSLLLPYIAISALSIPQPFLLPPRKPFYSLGRFGLSLLSFFVFATMYYFSSVYRTSSAVYLTLSFLVGGIGNLQLSRYAPRDLDLSFTLQTLLLGGCVGVIGMGYDQEKQSAWIAGFIVIAFSQYVILITHRLI